MLKIFTGRTEKFTRLVRFYVHMPAQEATAPALAEGAGPAQVLARFDDREGSPAIASRRLGAGSVIMFYSSADVKWTDWPKDLTFLPVVNDMVASLARREALAWTAPVGQKIRYVLPPALAEAPALSLRTPAYPEEDLLQLKPHLEGKSEVVEYASPRWAGVYTLQATLPDKTVRTMLFTRTIDPAEGDLAKADESEIGRAVGQPHTYRGRMAVGGSSLAREVSQTAYWGVLIATVLALLALEIFLAQRFGHYTARAAAK
jgi:hypothetical protein